MSGNKELHNRMATTWKLPYRPTLLVREWKGVALAEAHFLLT